jgi:hypothetical protein
MIKERNQESDTEIIDNNQDVDSDKSELLYDDSQEDLVRSRRKNGEDSTSKSFKRSFQPGNFGEYIEHKINQYFDSSNITTANKE